MIGRVIRAMSQCWHPTCFKCVSCHAELADIGFVKNQGRWVKRSSEVETQLASAAVALLERCPCFRGSSYRDSTVQYCIHSIMLFFLRASHFDIKPLAVGVCLYMYRLHALQKQPDSSIFGFVSK